MCIPLSWEVSNSIVVLNRFKFCAKSKNEMPDGSLGRDGFLCFQQVIKKIMKMIIIIIKRFLRITFQL